MKNDLTFDPEVMDIKFERDEDGTHFNIPQRIKHHSPTGMEWGYAGSGPADFALNILALFEPGKDVQCWRGKCSQFAYSKHQRFKRDFIQSWPREGGVITGNQIRAWIENERKLDQAHRAGISEESDRLYGK